MEKLEKKLELKYNGRLKFADREEVNLIMNYSPDCENYIAFTYTDSDGNSSVIASKAWLNTFESVCANPDRIENAYIAVTDYLIYIADHANQDAFSEFKRLHSINYFGLNADDDPDELKYVCVSSTLDSYSPETFNSLDENARSAFNTMKLLDTAYELACVAKKLGADKDTVNNAFANIESVKELAHLNW